MDFPRPQDRLKAFASLHGIQSKDVEKQVEDLGVILLANSFFTHLFGHSLLDATHPQINTFMESEDVYLRWSKSYNTPPSFETLKSKVNLLLPKL